MLEWPSFSLFFFPSDAEEVKKPTKAGMWRVEHGLSRFFHMFCSGMWWWHNHCVCVHVFTLSQGAIQLAGRSEPGGSADRGGDHDPRLLPWLLPGKTHAPYRHGQQTWTWAEHTSMIRVYQVYTIDCIYTDNVVYFLIKQYRACHLLFHASCYRFPPWDRLRDGRAGRPRPNHSR